MSNHDEPLLDRGADEQPEPKRRELDLVSRIRRLTSGQPYAVLCTQGEGQPYGSLVAFAFSDEVGHSKPHRAMFAAAAEQLDVPIESMIHIGDRDHNDVQGAHALGMKAILFTATRDVDRTGTHADAICERYADLPGIVGRVAAE